MKIYFLAVILISGFDVIESQLGNDKTDLSQNSCESKTTCGPCIQTEKCAWCMQPDFGESSRCFQRDTKPATLCPDEFTISPANELRIIQRDDLVAFSAGQGSDQSLVSNTSHVQISPQHVHLKLRINETLRMTVNFAQAELNYVELGLDEDQYKRILFIAEMKDNATGPVKVEYYSKCRGSEREQTNKCDGLNVGVLVSFQVEIVVTSCPAEAEDRKQTFKIYPDGVGEALTINLEMICSCDCETSGPTFEENSSECFNSGTLSCGVCKCREGFFGRKCECNNQDLGSESGLGAFKCRPNNETDVECSGRGNCVCGQCHCNVRENVEEIVYGQFCECDNFSCDRHNSLSCSGPDHGVCE